MLFCIDKAPGGRLGILGMYSEGRPARGSVVHTWLHAVKHTKTLNFDLNLRVSGGVCGSAGMKRGVFCGCGPCLKAADFVYRSPCFSD